MVLCGYIPLLHALGVVFLIVAPLAGALPAWTAVLSPIALYVLPPLAVRLALRLRPLEEGRFAPSSGTFLRWWFSAQWQAIFNRLPVLEELLRLVPALYSAWLRLWGARIGGLVYWSPGCRVLDRSLVEVGSRVVFGVGARLHPHLIARGDGGETELMLAPVRIGDEAMIGGMSLLGPGVRVHDGEMTPGVYALPPFSEWRGGKRLHHHPTLIR